MAELLLVGTTHYPPLIYPDEGMYSQLRKHVESDRTPPDMKIEANWPQAMQQEYGPTGPMPRPLPPPIGTASSHPSAPSARRSTTSTLTLS